MEWQDFLNNPLVVSYIKQSPPESPGKYLYKKMLHDILECLNGYDSFMQVAFLTDNISTDIEIWSNKWNPSIKNWISIITEYSSICYGMRDAVDNQTEWQKMITNLVPLTTGISELEREAQKLVKLSDDELMNLIEDAIANIARLNLILQYIRNQEYILLWTTKY